MAERKLASIQKVVSVNPIDSADNIEKIKILEWQCVSKKNEFHIDDLVCYCEIDSMIPIKPEFEWLRKSCYKKMHTGEEGFRIKTIQLRKTLSQGLAIPLSMLPAGVYWEGQDVTEVLGVFKYEAYIPPEMAGEVWGQKPYFCHTTDELRLQSYPSLLEEIKGKKAYVSTKLDGASMSVYAHPSFERQFGVCSRNLELKESDSNTLWKVANKYGLKAKLVEYGKPIVLQGEIVGPGIQGNRLKLLETDWFIFDIWFPEENRYVRLGEMGDICNRLGLKTVPIESTYDSFNFTIEELLKMSEGKYEGTNNNIEGKVYRCIIPEYSPTLNGRLSFKVLNNAYLLKDEA